MLQYLKNAYSTVNFERAGREIATKFNKIITIHSFVTSSKFVAGVEGFILLAVLVKIDL